MKLSKKGLDFIKSFEGYHTKLPNGDCKAYWDRTGRIWTIGWGCTEGVRKGDVWTREKAERYLLKEISKHERAVKKLCKEFGFTPNQNQYDALVSHSYNCGPGGTRHVMRRGFNFSSYGQTSGGVRLRGLVRRRKAEQRMFNRPIEKNIVENSRQLKTSWRLQRFIEWTGIGGLISWTTLKEVQEFVNPDQIVPLIVGGVAVWLVLKYMDFRTIEAAKEGRYLPSEMDEAADDNV